MNIINIAFTDIKASRSAAPKGNINISNNIRVLDVEESKMSIDKTRKTIELKFNYLTSYEPSVGKIELEGKMLIIDEEKAVKELLEYWKKEKKLPKEHAPNFLNPIMTKAVLETIFLARELELPIPVPMPNVRTK